MDAIAGNVREKSAHTAILEFRFPYRQLANFRVVQVFESRCMFSCPGIAVLENRRRKNEGAHAKSRQETLQRVLTSGAKQWQYNLSTGRKRLSHSSTFLP